jgi:hypothetical protein
MSMQPGCVAQAVPESCEQGVAVPVHDDPVAFQVQPKTQVCSS